MKRALILYVLFVCLAGLLGACGGGGGGNTSPAQLSLSIDLTSLPAATVNMTYNQTVAMTTSGGTAPYLYSCSVTNGAGLSASVSSSAPTTGGALCVISGTPLTAGTVTLNFSVSDSTKASASAGPLSVMEWPSECGGHPTGGGPSRGDRRGVRPPRRHAGIRTGARCR